MTVLFIFKVLKTDFNLIVAWSGGSTVKVQVPASYRGNLCGLCGDGNGGGRVTSDGNLVRNCTVSIKTQH